MKYWFSFVFLVFVSCKAKKEISKVEIVEESKTYESTNWIRTENVFSKIDGSSHIEFEGISDVFVDFHGNIQVKGNNPKIATKISRIDSIFKTDTVFIEKQVEEIKEVKSKEIKKERTAIPFWVYAVLILLIAGFIAYRLWSLSR